MLYAFLFSGLIVFLDQADHHDDDADDGDHGCEDEGEHQAQIRYRGPEPSGFRVPLSDEIAARNQHNDHCPDAADQGQETADQCFFHTQSRSFLMFRNGFPFPMKFFPSPGFYHNLAAKERAAGEAKGFTRMHNAQCTMHNAQCIIGATAFRILCAELFRSGC